MTRVGLLFPGEMGALVGAAARGDVVWSSEGRSVATAARAREAGIRDVGTLDALVSESETVISVCPPAIAEQVAESVAERNFDGLFVEANAIAPHRSLRIAERLAEHEASVVDGGIIGQSGIHLYLSGDQEGVERASALFAGSDVDAIPLPGGIGAASALKMAFGGWNKAGIALAAQAHAIARAYGVQDALEREGVKSDRVLRAGPKAWRWSPEMEEVAETCRALGLPDGLGRAAAELYERWSAHRDRPAPLERLLDDLTAANPK